MDYPEQSKANRYVRGKFNQALLKCETLDAYMTECLSIQEKYGTEIWRERTFHNEFETFSELAKLYKARIITEIEGKEIQKEYRAEFLNRLELCDSPTEFEKLEEEFYSSSIKDDAEVQDEISKKDDQFLMP